MQQPRSLTRFRCWSLEIIITSFTNSSRPWLELFESLFTAISCPNNSSPFKFWWYGNIFKRERERELDLGISLKKRTIAPRLYYLVNRTKTALSYLICAGEVICWPHNGNKIKQWHVQIFLGSFSYKIGRLYDLKLLQVGV